MPEFPFYCMTKPLRHTHCDDDHTTYTADTLRRGEKFFRRASLNPFEYSIRSTTVANAKECCLIVYRRFPPVECSALILIRL